MYLDAVLGGPKHTKELVQLAPYGMWQSTASHKALHGLLGALEGNGVEVTGGEGMTKGANHNRTGDEPDDGDDSGDCRLQRGVDRQRGAKAARADDEPEGVDVALPDWGRGECGGWQEVGVHTGVAL